MGLKKCPHCGGEQFYATLMREAIITVNSDNKIAIIKNSPAGVRFEVYECANENCKKKINNASLVDNSSVKCKVCGETVSAEDVDENGVCSACRAISNSGKSPMELLRELLGPANIATTAPIVPTATTETVAEPVSEEKPKKKRVSRKKKEEAPVEIPAENTTNDATEAPTGFMNAPKEEAEDDSDDIPFPDFDDTGFKEEEKPKTPAVEEKPAPPTSNAKFSMYDDDEDSDDEDDDDDEEYDDDDDEQF
jgi:hypothetical protein